MKVDLLLMISPLEEICICANYFHISHMPTIVIYVLNNVEIVEKLMHTLLFTFRGSKGRYLSIEVQKYDDWTRYRKSSSMRIMMIKSSSTSTDSDLSLD